jgi:excisionase family DNA binding protein
LYIINKGEGMEKLLTIKEAAAFLKVSEMSLRRWTNSGKLKCYRVGGKNERRFTRQELESVLRTSERLVPLGIGDTAVEDCSHIAHFYKDTDECITEGIKYLSCGLSRGESLLILSTDNKLKQILSGLNSLGFPVDKLKNDKRIFSDSGRFHFDEQVEFLTSAIENMSIDKGFRLLGDMMWAVEKGWSLDEITRLEAKADLFLIGKNNLILCQYDLTYFGADGAMMAFDAHSLTIYRGEVKQSPYFIGTAH